MRFAEHSPWFDLEDGHFWVFKDIAELMRLNEMPEKNIGQHISTGPATENGQRTKSSAPGVNVGQRSGGEMQDSIPTTRKDSDISTTSHSVAGALAPGEKGGADDRK
jgi:hypothetical protein